MTDNPIQSEKLGLCPFCGEEMTLTSGRSAAIDAREFYNPSCDRCNYVFQDGYYNIEDAIKAANSRAPVVAPQADDLRKAVSDFGYLIHRELHNTETAWQDCELGVCRRARALLSPADVEPTTGADGRYCAHHDDDPAHGRECYEVAPSPSSPVPPEPLGKLIIKAVDDAVMRVGASANCYDVPADANRGAEYVAARVRSVIAADCIRQAQRSAATPTPVEGERCWHCERWLQWCLERPVPPHVANAFCVVCNEHPCKLITSAPRAEAIKAALAHAKTLNAETETVFTDNQGTWYGARLDNHPTTSSFELCSTCLQANAHEDECPEGYHPLTAATPTPVEQERETLIYWLLRAYQSGHREGWEPGPSTDETMDGICSVLANRGYDPSLSDTAKELLKRKLRY